MLNYIWLALILLAVFIGGFDGKMKEVTEGAVEGSKSAVTLSIGLVGIMALWLGMMRLAEKAGLVQGLARLLRPVLRWLFPEVPVNHPAMGSMVLNIAANMLGLTNAATPLGLRAMKHLESLNRLTGTSSNAMCTFLTINTSGVQLLPATAVALLASSGSANPTAIVGTALLATLCSTVVGVTAVKFFEKLRMYRLPKPEELPANEAKSAAEAAPESESAAETTEAKPLNFWGKMALAAFGFAWVYFLLRMAMPEQFGGTPAAPDEKTFVRVVNAVSAMAIPLLLSFFPLYAILRQIKVYEEFVEGAKEGFNVAIRIIPYLVAILVAISMFRGAGGIDMLTKFLRPALDLVGFPAELLPMGLMRPLSGSGAYGILADTVKAFGPDSLLGRTAATMYGSTETTFYVLAVYFGSVGIRRTRHAVPAGLVADVVGIFAAIYICRAMFA